MDINWEALGEEALDQLILWAPRVVAAIAIFVLGRIAAKLARRIVRKIMGRAKVEPMLTNFTVNILYTVLVAFVTIAALDKLGVPTGSLVAIFAAAGLAVGFALQGSLGNFAAGVMVILFRPFNLGDFIDAGGVTGIVEEIQVFSTILRTPDNKCVIIPNGKVMGDVITNYSRNDTRRVDLVAGIGYGDDIAQAQRILEDIVASEPLALADPAPSVALMELADSSVNFNVRPWCKTEDYWACYSAITEAIKVRFDDAGISIPYPQQDVHMHQAG